MTLKTIRLLCSIIVPASLLMSCNGNFLDTPEADGEDTLKAEAATVSAASASFAADGEVRDTVRFSSNLSWSAGLPEDCSWIRLDRAYDLNLSGKARDYSIGISLEDNTSASAREAVLTISTGTGKIRITINQKALEPELSLLSASVVNMPCEGGEVEISIRSNVSWTATAGDDATAAISPASVEVFKSGSAIFTILPNLDEENGKTATVTISAEGCESRTVIIKQAKYTV